VISGCQAQIDERVSERAKEREEFYIEGIKQKKERLDRQKKLDHIKTRKADVNVPLSSLFCSTTIPHHFLLLPTVYSFTVF
jgi:hypothetical protein